MGRVVTFVRPLAWCIDLDLRGHEAQMVGEVLAGIPKTMRNRTYRGLALRMKILETCVVRDDVRADLRRLIERCRPVRDQSFSEVGAALVARYPRDKATSAQLRRLTRDPRILERLGL